MKMAKNRGILGIFSWFLGVTKKKWPNGGGGVPPPPPLIAPGGLYYNFAHLLGVVGVHRDIKQPMR